MRPSPLPAARRESGIALVIVMIVVISLALLAGGFVMSMKIETRLARNSQFDPDLDWLGRSGVEVARYVVGQSMNIANEPYDALNQFWAGGTGGTNLLLPPEISLDKMTLAEGSMSIKIMDAERRFNINVADEFVLQQALRVVGVDASEFGTVTGSILDWIDADDDTHIGGVETGFYQRLNPPYSAKNGPVDDMSELLMINGVTPAMYWGGGSDPARVIPRNVLHQGAAQDAAAGYRIGLSELFTAVGNARLNVNTASTEALMLIPGMDENLAGAVISVRAGPDGQPGNLDDRPFRSVGELAGLVPGLDPMFVQTVARFCDVRSATFEVQVTASIGGLQREYRALLRRNQPQDVQILQFYWR